LTPAHQTASVFHDGPSAWKVKREAGAKVLILRTFNAGAAPATVSDEPSPVPLGNPGKAADGNDPRVRRPAITNCALEASSGRGAPDGSELNGEKAVKRDPTKLAAASGLDLSL
jgi:hypothetical protein